MELIDPINEPGLWDQTLSTHPQATAFHTSAWARVLNRTYQHRPFYLKFQDGATNALVPIMEVNSPICGRRGVSLPFSDCCPPLFNQACNLNRIREHIVSLAHQRRWKYVELRGDQLAASPSPAHCPPRTVCPPSTASRLPTFCAHHLDLTIGSERLLAACSSSARRALRKAQQSPLKVRVEGTEQAMFNFFRLHVSTRRRHGLPAQPYRFFQNIYEELISKGFGTIVSAYHTKNNRPIAAAVFLNYNNTAIYKFGASDSYDWHLRPNNLLIWEAIQHLAKSGVKHLHFGRTAPVHNGLRQFKLSWGTQEQPLDYIRFNCRNRCWNSVKSTFSLSLMSTITRQVLAYTPLFLNRAAGTLLYPHLD